MQVIFKFAGSVFGCGKGIQESSEFSHFNG